MSSQYSTGATTTGGAQAIRRAVDTLRAVAQLQRSGASLSRVARATGMNTSTSFRILRSLSEERLLHYDEGEHRYYLGPLAYELGLAATQKTHSDVEQRWRPAVESIAQRTRLTTYLMARSNQEAVCLSCIQGSTVLRAMPVDVGQRLPLGIGAGSLAILATLEDDDIRRVLQSQALGLSQVQWDSDVIESILRRVALAKERGFSVSSGTISPGLSGIGVAIKGAGQSPSLAISISAVAKEFSVREVQEIVAIISSAIEQCLQRQREAVPTTA
jgi:DNA-binding IclR family transcriptional regulator